MINAVVLLCAAGLIALDQILKAWMLELLSGGPIMLIPGLLQLTYVENRGAAFGIFQGRVTVLSVITAVVLIVAVVLLLMGKFKHPVELWSIGLIIAGGAGNLIDRIARGYVIDYLDISPLFSFPVFNLADCCVVIGTCVLAFYLIMLDGKSPKKSGGEAAAGVLAGADVLANEADAAGHGATDAFAGGIDTIVSGAGVGDSSAAADGNSAAADSNSAAADSSPVEAGDSSVAAGGKASSDEAIKRAERAPDLSGGAKADE